MNKQRLSIPLDVSELYAPPFFTALKIRFPPGIDAAEMIPFLEPPIINNQSNDFH
jgi:hypothetical protein